MHQAPSLTCSALAASLLVEAVAVLRLLACILHQPGSKRESWGPRQLMACHNRLPSLSVMMCWASQPGNPAICCCRLKSV